MASLPLATNSVIFLKIHVNLVCQRLFYVCITMSLLINSDPLTFASLLFINEKWTYAQLP